MINTCEAWDTHVAHEIQELTGLNRTWGSADLSARWTFGRPVGRLKVRFNPSPPPDLFRPKKNGRKSGWTLGRPKVRSIPSPPLY